MTKETIKTILPSATIYSLESLFQCPDPLYGRIYERENIFQTIHWMNPKDSGFLKWERWQIISSLCYFSNLGLCRIWANSLNLIYYGVHFNKGIPVYPLIVKENGRVRMQIDFMVLSNRNTQFYRPYAIAVYAGLRYRIPSFGNIIIRENMIALFLQTIMEFFIASGQFSPLLIAVEKNKKLVNSLFEIPDVKTESVPIKDNTVYMVMAFSKK
ncbi:hypothetical protein [Rhizosphaericola mali]|uniref:Uncharacterized protein n=1 Tax=Rhizosphaericola mali TaxID=2545455 RepID=A0A5P2G1G0_9BACT|nr:hypothetical protein [Rhizosphaericola mali]QES88528.1 hypothetical protein E0W69_007590 [Rhizosphaericola mali]